MAEEAVEEVSDGVETRPDILKAEHVLPMEEQELQQPAGSPSASRRWRKSWAEPARTSTTTRRW